MDSQFKYKYLDKINSPDDLRKLDIKNLIEVCGELRHFIIDSISKNPGHLGASLGVVELTVALHYAYNTPEDLIVWDVGHQAYGHKILTGRRDTFHSNRKLNGISGFPSPKESIYDSFGVGHSSTSISAALGMAVASKLKGKNRDVIAVIGDGSLTGGLAFEGLNNVASTKSNMLIILNDNKIAIDDSTGALREYLTDISTSKTYNKIKDDVWKFLGRLDRLGGANMQSFTQKIDNALKSIILRNSNLFESLGIRYFGPVDGHDVVLLSKLLEDLKDIKGPKILHIITKKGKGFKKAETDQTGWHAAPGCFNAKTGEVVKSDKNKNIIKFQDVFGETLIDLAKQNKKIVAITPAMLSGCSLVEFNRKYPDRCFDVGIAEQHAVTFAAGLAIQGLRPFCNIYSSFTQRAYDQIIHDVALQKLPVVMCLDRAGLVGHDGATHHGAYDLSFLNCIPDIVISAPRNAEKLKNLLFTAQLEKVNFPFVIRYPRGNTKVDSEKKSYKEIEIGKAECLKTSTNELALISIGSSANIALEVADNLTKDNLQVAVYDMVFLKPLDKETLHSVFKQFKTVFTIEDNSVIGGLGSVVAEFIADNNYDVTFRKFGIPDRFIEHGTQNELIELCEFDTQSLIKNIKKVYKTLKVY